MAERQASVAIVGAGDFIGAAIARRFAAEGYRVHGGRRQREKLAGLAEEIGNAGASFGHIRSTPGTNRRSSPSSTRPT
ncbi:MAG TPA: SDR family NAD(P)-dependent oxidoreductase, partial [Allosphingosinicella sp.]